MKNSSFLFTIFLFGLIIIACQKDDDLIENDQPTVFNLHLTDNPVDAQQVNVDIQKVYLFGHDEKDSISMGTNAGVYDLLTLQNGVDTLLASALLTIDTVKQIRLILGEDNTIMVDSALHDLKTPSAQQSGLKIKVDIVLSELDSANVILDFDACESIKEQGNGTYMLKPVLKIK